MLIKETFIFDTDGRKRLRPLSAVSVLTIATGSSAEGRIIAQSEAEIFTFYTVLILFIHRPWTGKTVYACWRKKMRGSKGKRVIFQATSRFACEQSTGDRNKIPNDPCALKRRPYNSSPGVVALCPMPGLSGLYPGFQVPRPAK